MRPVIDESEPLSQGHVVHACGFFKNVVKNDGDKRSKKISQNVFLNVS